jgi:hypothetical protein
MLLLPQLSSQQARLAELLAGNPAALSQSRTLSGELQDVPAPTGD